MSRKSSSNGSTNKKRAQTVGSMFRSTSSLITGTPSNTNNSRTKCNINGAWIIWKGWQKTWNRLKKEMSVYRITATHHKCVIWGTQIVEQNRFAAARSSVKSCKISFSCSFMFIPFCAMSLLFRSESNMVAVPCVISSLRHLILIWKASQDSQCPRLVYVSLRKR